MLKLETFFKDSLLNFLFDDVFSNGNSGFFTSESIYGTNLTGFATLYSNFIFVPTDPYGTDADLSSFRCNGEARERT